MNEIFQNPKNPYTQRLMNSSPEPKLGTKDLNNEILKISSLNLTYSKRALLVEHLIFLLSRTSICL